MKKTLKIKKKKEKKKKRKNNTATNFKRKKTPGAFRELKKLLGAQAIMLVHLGSP